MVSIEFFQVLKNFEETLKNLIDNFLDQVRALFLQGRQIDIRFFKSLSSIGECMESAAYEKQAKTKSGINSTTTQNKLKNDHIN